MSPWGHPSCRKVHGPHRSTEAARAELCFTHLGGLGSSGMGSTRPSRAGTGHPPQPYGHIPMVLPLLSLSPELPQLHAAKPHIPVPHPCLHIPKSHIPVPLFLSLGPPQKPGYTEGLLALSPTVSAGLGDLRAPHSPPVPPPHRSLPHQGPSPGCQARARGTHPTGAAPPSRPSRCPRPWALAVTRCWGHLSPGWWLFG